MDKKAKKRSLGLSKTEKRIIICTAAVVLIALLIYPTVTYLVPFIKYSHAVSLMEKGSFSLTESCLLFYNKKDVSALHRQLSSHHENEIEKNKADYIEMVLDWESARYTKPDKPLNAYDTLYKYYPEMEKEILPILKEFNIDKPNLPMEQDVVEYAEKIKNYNSQHKIK